MATFQGKVAIVTGGAKGIGKGIAKEFAEEGARVAIADVDDEAGAETAAEVPGAMFVHADVASNEDCRRLVAQTVTEFGGVDVLVNNAGIQPPESYQNVEGTSEETWDRIIDVNLKSCFLMSKHAIPEMRKRGGGAIVNIASVQGLQSQNLVPPYAASKGGVLSLTRQMALDYASENIRVLAVNPGAIDTPMLRAAASLESGDTGAVVEEWGTGHPLGRIGTPQDIAGVVVFLASDKASFMTGEYVCVDGGYMALGAWASAAGAAAVDH
jgi:NAD(P)-dependent dehydrogenase (short-subunit alcohol dehydrogenase family)